MATRHRTLSARYETQSVAGDLRYGKYIVQASTGRSKPSLPGGDLDHTTPSAQSHTRTPDGEDVLHPSCLGYHTGPDGCTNV